MTSPVPTAASLASSLHWVQGELEQSLNRVRALIEQYMDAPGQALPLQQALVELHQVRGTATMIQCPAIAVVANEMKHTLQDLLQDRIKEKEAAFAALLGAGLQLADYIDALAAGAGDCVLVFQPAINELRVARGHGVLTEADLFVDHMQALGVSATVPPAETRKPGAAQAAAQKYQRVFQQNLLQWLKGQEPQMALGRLGKIAELLAGAATLAPVFQLWRAVAAAVEAQLAAGGQDTLELKRLFGRVGSHLKALAEEGEANAASAFGDLAYQILYYVGRSPAQGPRVAQLRKAYRLDRHLPSAEAIAGLRRKIRGPNTVLLGRLSEEIRRDFAQVKDNIDLVARAGAKAQIDFSGTVEKLRRVGTTLNMLGLGALQRVVENQAQALAALKAVEGAAADPAWVEVATALLRVEHSLDDALFRQLRQPDAGAGATVVELDAKGPHSRDVREGMAALLRELLVDIARIKQAVDAFIKAGDPSGLGEASRLCADAQSGLRMLGHDRAAELTGRLGAYLRSAGFAQVRSEPGLADRFADAVACVEYFLEALQKREPDAQRLIEPLAGIVDRLRIPEDVPVHDTQMFQAPAAPAPAAAPVSAEAAAVDPEIRAVFLEEAGEVRGQLEERLPRFKRDPADRDSLVEIRRSFHTLKGSGRMVGATHIGSFGWALESLLNHCLDGSVATTPAIVQTVEDGLALLPRLIDGFRDGLPPPPELAGLVERAERQVKGEPQAASGILDVFKEDARERLGAVRAWLERQDRGAGEFPLDVEPVRALHTLRGSAAAVQEEPVSRLAGALEHYLDALRGAGLPLPPDGLRLLDEATAALGEWAQRAGGGGPAPDVQPWLERVERMQTAVPSAAVEAAEDRRLADDFANEACDLLQQVEAALKAWAAQPDATFHARNIKTLFQTLHGAAVTARCAALGQAAQAFDQRMTEFAGGGVPDPALFPRLAELVEAMYQMLDAFREGALRDDGAALAARVFQLEGGTMPPAEVAVEAAVEEVIEIPPVAAAEGEAPPDRELLEVFLGEGEELLENLDRQFDAWERAPDAAGPVAELLRTLHTLKGSARMAGVRAIGDAAHGMETLLTRMQQGRMSRDALLFGRLHKIVDGLHALLDQLRRGDVPAADALLAELEGEGSAAPAAPVEEAPRREIAPAETHAFRLDDFDRPAMREEPVAAVRRTVEPPVVEAIEIPPVAAAPEPMPAPTVAPAPPAAPTLDARLGSFDPELAEVFAGEAAELMELLHASLAAWQADISNAAPLRELQRALHTLKGGARIAGLKAIGEAAHEMESEVERIERGQAAADEPAFARLRQQLERLQRMQDRLARGEAAALAREPVPLEDVTVSVPPVLPAELPPLPPMEPLAEPRVQVLAEPAPAGPAPAAEAAPAGGWDPQLFWRPDDEAADAAALRRETARVAVEQLDGMLNQAGEISIYRSRLEQHVSAVEFQLNEMQQTIGRTRELLRSLELETEAQIAARGVVHTEQGDRYGAEFDPLEMDRYTRMQELTRALSESLNDLSSIHNSVEEQSSESETLLMQQGRITTQIQQGLMGTLMVPFSRQVQRLQRVVKQTAAETGKQAEVEFEGIEAEMDRNVLERMTAPLEHLLRNAVVHGLEEPAAREAAGKPAAGRIRVGLKREGTQLALEVGDDGRGLDYDAIRATAIKRGLMAPDARLADEDIAQFIFEPGFSTADKLTQSAGRGVGMDVVAAEVKQLGGTLSFASEAGKGMRFLILLPLSLAISQALLVGVGSEMYAIPLPTIEGIARVETDRLAQIYAAPEDEAPFRYGGNDYRLSHLGELLGVAPPEGEAVRSKSAILIRAGEALWGAERRIGVVVDALYGSREIVSKGVGPQISSVLGVTGATILPDGRVVLILDVAALAQGLARRARAVAEAAAAPEPAAPVAAPAGERPLVMVVDDSITIRRVTERLLDKAGFAVATAKDGLDAIAQLQAARPAAILLDIEMPRADGFEVATFVRNNERLKEVPILMITSRSGEKHRERARQLGVNRYLIKPYQEEQMLAELRGVLEGGA
ncbi:MAG: Hpt domain-containing protein [Gammaproteobacteria bacterium]|nr:Hpt domain-containing protein [Gammaproteobacteria bacterium]